MNKTPERADATDSSFPDVNPLDFPIRTVGGLQAPYGFPDPYHATPAVKLLRSAEFWIDTAYSVSGERCAVNQGTGGFALNACYGGNIGVATTNDPLWLDKRADQPSYVYLPGSASNTIGCTAPAGTASYAAYPASGAAATTGAASAGAFTLQTTGSWKQLDLLDAGSAVLASFIANNSAGTGYTDAYSVAWTIARSTSGRKSVLVTRPVWLFGTDDYMEVPNHPLLDMPNNQSMTVIAIMRSWATQVSSSRYIDKSNTTDTGWSLQNQSTNAAIWGSVDDGPNQVARNGLSTYTLGNLTSIGFVANRTTQVLQTFSNNTFSASASIAGVAGCQNRLPMRIGSNAACAGGAFVTMELAAAAIFRRTLTTGELATICTYYGTA